MKNRAVGLAVIVSAILCSCSLFTPSTQIRFQNNSSVTFNGIKLGATYDAQLPATTGMTTYSQISAGDYVLMYKSGSGNWVAFLDQYGDTFDYTLNGGRQYTLTISDAGGGAVSFSLTFVRD